MATPTFWQRLLHRYGWYAIPLVGWRPHVGDRVWYQGSTGHDAAITRLRNGLRTLGGYPWQACSVQSTDRFGGNVTLRLPSGEVTAVKLDRTDFILIDNGNLATVPLVVHRQEEDEARTHEIVIWHPPVGLAGRIKYNELTETIPADPACSRRGKSGECLGHPLYYIEETGGQIARLETAEGRIVMQASIDILIALCRLYGGSRRGAKSVPDSPPTRALATYSGEDGAFGEL